MNNKRVFILGAGFSKQVGMPLATELTEPLLERFKQNNIPEMLKWYESLKRRIEWMGNNINIEQVFDLAAFDIEAWRMRQQQESVGRKTGNAWNNAENIDTWLSWMEYDLGNVIWNKQEESRSKLEVIEKFSQNLQADDVVLTFNYDTLLEESLTKQSKQWHYGFKLENGQGTKILKMHGSINWKVTNRKKTSSGNVSLFRKEYLEVSEGGVQVPDDPEYKYELVRVSDKEVEGFIRRREIPFNLEDFVGITGLGAHKALHLLPGSWKVWSNAMKALEETDEIYIVGFSLSSFDSMVRLHFAGAMLDRNEKGNLPKQIMLIDPYACNLKPKYQSVFGNNTPITVYQHKAEQVNWYQLLSC